MSRTVLNVRKAFLTGSSILAIAAAGILIHGAPACADDPQMETIVVTGTLFNPDAAPAKASLDTNQPQTIINRSYIEDFVTPTADYVTILSIAPSLTGTDPNGPGLSDNGVKNTLRGLPDGQYGMSYDGIPFGDTNGPSHHSASYFPSTTVGSVLVDRGPGNAGTLGAATYGGTIKLFSEPLSDTLHGKVMGSYGSFATRVEAGNFQSGEVLGSTRAMVNVQNTHSDGALSFQDFDQSNILFKGDFRPNDDWTFSAFATYNVLTEHLNDNAGETPAQVAAYGKNFALQNTNPNLTTFWQYSRTQKKTDLEYARAQGKITDGLNLEDELYSYYYTNRTFSARDITQTGADITAGVTEGNTAKLAPIVGGVKQPLTDAPGYKKLNQYRVWGNILRLSEDYKFSSVTGQVRAGVWYESANTQRFRYDYDVTLCNKLGIDPYYTNATSACWDSSLGAKAVKLADGYAEFDEHTNWLQYQPFLEVDISPLENLTITPGVKYINWVHKTNATIEPKLLKPYVGQFTTTDTLTFVEAHYKITPTWSAYAQYAEGIYIPDISSFEQATPVGKFPDAQTTTNYQVGTVFYADQFSFDADYYYIPVHNNIVSVNCGTIGGSSGETCFVNTGNATYKGFEGEATYAFQGAVRGLSLFVNGSVMSAKSNGLTLKGAPKWTGAAGVIYKANGWKFSLVDKTVGPQFMDNAETAAYKLESYSNVDASAGYAYKFVELTVSVNNLFDSRKTAAISIKDNTYQTNQLNSLDQYYYQAPRSVMATVKAKF